MPDTTHTPTPWKYELNGGGDYTLTGGSGITYTIGEVSNFNERPTNEANAAFIVRAVNAHDDLVAALKECQAELYDITHSSGDPADATNMGSAAVVYRTVVAALTKAGA